MKKLFITLRHPGPAQAILAILPDLCKRYFVALAASDAAWAVLDKLFSCKPENLNLYGSMRGKWELVQCLDEIEHLDTLQFPSPFEPGYQSLIHSLAGIIRQFQPDIALRTTPACLWGVDEALGEACVLAGISCQCRCYQDWYYCGQGLVSFPGEIAVPDEIAAQILRHDGIQATPVGWLNALQFRSLPPYQHMRRKTRAQLGLNDDDVAILYCASTCDDILAEVEHFASVVALASTARLFIRFHPRTSVWEREAYLQRAKGLPLTVDDLPLESSIAFADYLVSAGSAINIDTLQYQTIGRAPHLSTVSVYTFGPLTNRIRQSAMGCTTIPLATPGKGSIILPELDLSSLTEPLGLLQRRSLFGDAERLFGGCGDTIVQHFIDYLENANRN